MIAQTLCHGAKPAPRASFQFLALIALVLISSASGCLPEFDQIHGEYILYESSDEYHPCAGTAEYANRVIPFLADQLGVSIPQSIRYSWLSDADVPGNLLQSVDGHLGGSTIGSHAWGENPVLVHELAHLVAQGRAAPPFFKEGLAVMMDVLDREGDGPRYRMSTDFDPLKTVGADSSTDVDFTAAGAFTTFLFVRHGPERFQSFYRSLRWPNAIDNLHDRFYVAFGVALSDEVEIFRKGTLPCEQQYFALQLSECVGSVIAWESPDRWSHTGNMDCEDPSVVGGYGSRPGETWPSFRLATLDVQTPGEYVLTVASVEPLKIRFGPCFGCPWDFSDITVFEERQAQVHLVKGRYYVRINSWSNEAPEFEVRLTRN